MNAALKLMLPAIEAWPPEDQAALLEAAREIAALRTGVYELSADEEAAIAEGLAQADRGEVRPADDVFRDLAAKYRIPRAE